MCACVCVRMWVRGNVHMCMRVCVGFMCDHLSTMGVSMCRLLVADAIPGTDSCDDNVI